MKLVFGVIDMPYANAPRSLRAKKVTSGTQTTGDVATWLENKYGVMEAFYNIKKTKIAAEMKRSAENAIESIMLGAPPSMNLYASATSEIERMFKQFLSMKEIEQLGIKGVPTGAAMRGVNHRMKHPYAKRAPRPSFIDTGLYQASFKAWTEK